MKNKNKKFMAFTAVLTATVLTGSSLAIFAAESETPDTDTVGIESEMTEPIAEEAEPETTAPIAEETEAETAAPIAEETAASDVEVIMEESEAAAPVAEETEAEQPAPDVEETEAEQPAPDVEVAEAEPDTATDDSDYSYHVGQQSSTARNDAYEALPEGGTKEDAEEFYETYEIGGGAWADGAYDESLKSGYGYAEGQQRAAQYAQDGDDDTEYKSGYSYSVGRQTYMDNYPNYSK